MVDWRERDLSYLHEAEYEQLFRRWLAEARVVHGIESAKKAAAAADGGGDIKVHYADAKELVRFTKALGLMEDLKAGVPRTAYHGVIPLRVAGRRVLSRDGV